MIEEHVLEKIIRIALQEDMPDGDITSENVIPPESTSNAEFVAKAEGVLAGIDVAEKVFLEIDSQVEFKKKCQDGDFIQVGDILGTVKGSSISLLKAERTALNFLQRMSGIATLTQRFVQELEGTPTRLLDTRKTTPGLRVLEKYAVRMGGGHNHRLNLSDMVMLKDNHLKLIGNISQAIERVRAKIKPGIKIEVETTSLKEAKEAFQAGADLIMLDNMSIAEMRTVVEWIDGRIPLEVSGKVDIDKVKSIAALGVDYISVGRLTHSFKSLDISLEFK